MARRRSVCQPGSQRKDEAAYGTANGGYARALGPGNREGNREHSRPDNLWGQTTGVIKIYVTLEIQGEFADNIRLFV